MKFLGVTILQGVEFSHFPIDFRMGLTTVQRDCVTALPVMPYVNKNNYVQHTWPD